MKNIMLSEKENAFIHMGEHIEMGQLGREMFDMARWRMSHYEEHFEGPGQGNLSSPASGGGWGGSGSLLL
jgi:hypothetical protein